MPPSRIKPTSGRPNETVGLKHMKSLLTGLIFAFISFSIYGGGVFDVTFEGTNFVENAVCPTGIPPVYPQYAPSLILDSTVFGSHVARPGYLVFNPDGFYSSGIHTFTWDYLAENHNTYGGWPDIAVTFKGSTVYVPQSYFYVLPDLLVIAPLSLNEVHRYKVIIDLDVLQTSFFIDETQFITNAPIQPGQSIDYVHMQVPGNNTSYIDNFRWEFIPATTTGALAFASSVNVDGLPSFVISNASPTKTICVQRCTNLVATNWIDSTNLLTGYTNWTDTATGEWTTIFYRLVR